MFYTYIYTCPCFSTLHPSFVPPFFSKKAQGAMAKYVRSKVPMEGAPHLRSCPWEVGGLVNLWEENHARVSTSLPVLFDIELVRHDSGSGGPWDFF